jgi:tRNA nucleotidyltransferase (CCA-adding enzyme)
VPLVVRHLAHLSCQSKKAVRRLAEALYPSTIIELGWVIEADQSGRPPIPAHMPEECKSMLRIAEECNCTTGKIVPLVTGKHLIALGIKPSKQLGHYLSMLFEAQLDGVFTSVEEGINWFNTKVTD